MLERYGIRTLNYVYDRHACIRMFIFTFEDFDGKYIHIRRQYIRGKWQTPKTKNSIRKIAVDEKTKSFIYELKKYYSSFDEFEESWFIFGGYRHMDPKMLRLRKNKA